MQSLEFQLFLKCKILKMEKKPQLENVNQKILRMSTPSAI